MDLTNPDELRTLAKKLFDNNSESFSHAIAADALVAAADEIERLSLLIDVQAGMIYDQG